jgi:hypothetical protein
MPDALPFAAVDWRPILLGAAVVLPALLALVLTYRLASWTKSAAGAQAIGCVAVPLVVAAAAGAALRFLFDSDVTDSLLGAVEFALVGLIPGVILGWAAGRRRDELPPKTG